MPNRNAEDELVALREEADRLRAERAASLAEFDARLADIEGRAERLSIYLELASIYEPAVAHPPLPQPAFEALQPSVSDAQKASPFFGKSLAEAGATLVSMAGRPLSDQEIVEGLVAHDMKLVSRQPVANLRLALRRRTDLVRNEGGKWHLVALPTGSNTPSGCMPNRDPTNHLAQTMKGLAAARERGVKGGRHPIFSPEIVAEAQRLMREEGLSPYAAGKRLGIKPSTVAKWKQAMKPETAVGKGRSLH